MTLRIVPAPTVDDDDDVVVALETARVSEERKDFEAAVKWLHRAAAAARRQSRPERAGDLSRSAARLGGAHGIFEKAADAPQVLSDMAEDDFSDQTIVESAAVIASKHAASAVPPSSKQPLTLDGPTPVAPLTVQSKAPEHHALRVAVKKTLGGRYEARPLMDGEEPGAGEQEALLVPVQGGKKL